MGTIDITRDATDFRKHYSGIRMQQGRVLTDDDYNEGARLDQEQVRRSVADIIGPAGSADNGFFIVPESVTLNPLDFKIDAGTLYLGGIRLELDNEDGQKYRAQDDWIQGPLDAYSVPTQDRTDLVYVEAYREPVTAVEDSEIREVALGGPDTSARVRTFRRVHILPLKGSDPDCSSAWQELSGQLPGTLTLSGELVSNLRLAVTFPEKNTPADLCSPRVTGGYLGAENQAIRVQLVDSAHLTWGFDNASPLYKVRLAASDCATVTLLTSPKDQHHWPAVEQVVEILPWGARLNNGEKTAEMQGHISRLKTSYNPDQPDNSCKGSIVLKDPVSQQIFKTWKSGAEAVAPSGDADLYCFMRVWERGSDTEQDAKIPFKAGEPVTLGNTGLQVTISQGPCFPGDYWIIAVRPETADQVVPWDLKTGRAPHGVRRFYAPLALIRWKFQNGKFQEAEVRDCRAPFVPLTSRWWWGGCSIVVAPVPGWERLLSYFQEGQDVSLCFQAGDYKLNRTLEFIKLKSIKMVGAGPGTRIVISGHETAFLFNGCESAIVRDLHIESQAPPRPGSQINEKHLNGAITFVDCTNVQVSDCDLACQDNSGRRQSCLMVRRTESETKDRVLIERNRLLVGAWQTGILVVNADHAVVRENHVSMAKAQKYPGLLLPGAFAASLESVVMAGFSKTASSATKEVKTKKSDARINVVAGSLAESLIKDFAKIAPKNVATAPGGVEGVLRRFSRGLAAGLGVNLLSTAGRNALETVRQSFRACGQGIVVAGTRIGTVQILENIVEDAIQGIHIGVSNPDIAGPESVQQVVLSRNSVHTLVPLSYSRDRHGIFVGNARSISITDTVATLRRTDVKDVKATEVEGIRIHGALGPFMVIRQNSLSGFAVGVRVVPENQPPAARVWLVAETVATGAKKALDAPEQVQRDRISPAGP